MSGILLSKTFGQQQASIEKFGQGVAAPRRPPDPAADDRPLVLRDDRHLLQHRAGLRLPPGRLADHRRRHERQHRHHRGLHHAPEPPLLPARPAAERAGRDPGRAGPLRPDLRVPRDGARDHRRARCRRPRPGRAARRRQVPASVTFRYPSPPAARGGRGRGRAGRGRGSRGADAGPAVRPDEIDFEAHAGPAGRPGRTIGRGQDDHHLPDPAPLRRRRRRGRDRRHRRARGSGSSRSGARSAW